MSGVSASPFWLWAAGAPRPLDLPLERGPLASSRGPGSQQCLPTPGTEAVLRGLSYPTKIQLLAT